MQGNLLCDLATMMFVILQPTWEYFVHMGIIDSLMGTLPAKFRPICVYLVLTAFEYGGILIMPHTYCNMRTLVFLVSTLGPPKFPCQAFIKIQGYWGSTVTQIHIQKCHYSSILILTHKDQRFKKWKWNLINMGDIMKAPFHTCNVQLKILLH